MGRFCVCVGVLAVASVADAQASVPQQLTYEGRLSTLSGAPSMGTHSIQFAIWATETGGGATPIWTDTLAVTVVDGLYAVTLGTTSGDALPAGLFDGTVRYLELTVDGDLLSPRQAIGSVPYSLLSGGVQGGPVNATSYAFHGTPIMSPAGHQIITFAGASKTISGLYCGATNLPTTGAITDPSSGAVGYRATQLICRNVCNSPTAHMCSAAEIVSTNELGGVLPDGGHWISTGLAAAFYDVTSATNLMVNDCYGWTNSTHTAMASGSNSTHPRFHFCDELHDIDCCD
jgi:hypothetical protein